MTFQNKWLHKSHLKVYKDCQMKFLLTYEDVILKNKKSCALSLSLGTAFHEWAAYIVDNKITDFNVIKEHIRVEPLYSMVEWFIEENKTLDSVWDKCELYMETDDYLRGTIDRVYQNSDGEIVLVEYKTGKVTFSPTKLDFAFYTRLLENNGYTVNKWQLINPMKRKTYTKTVQRKVQDSPLTKDEAMKGIEMGKIQDTIFSIRNKTLTDFELAKYVQYWCYDCPNRTTCDKYNSYHSRGMATLDELKVKA